MEDNKMDYLITTAVLAAFACILYRKYKKKKLQVPDSSEVQTSEHSLILYGQGPGAGQGTGLLLPYPDGSQTEMYAFDFRKYADTSALSADIEAKLNRYLIDCQHSDRTAFVRYVPVGTTLLVECVHTL